MALFTLMPKIRPEVVVEKYRQTQLRHNSTAKKSYSRQNKTALKVTYRQKELMSLFCLRALYEFFRSTPVQGSET
ncbi:hypothetical protein [Ruegeria sp. Alg231-54]|uniref:hypothetical protein n=1 Tax=Ruegeria sp. Alg231-54 TaxID=1922221 RepID=UPI00131F0DE1|nr:hypothetical protein [Ruegeria sp. Alg231-54]